MTTRRDRGRSSGGDDVESVGEQDFPAFEEKPAEDAAKPETKAAPVAEPKTPEAEVIPIAEREITLQRFAREKGPLGQAFVTSVLLEESARVTKAPKSVWVERYNAWLKKPR